MLLMACVLCASVPVTPPAPVFFGVELGEKLDTVSKRFTVDKSSSIFNSIWK